MPSSSAATASSYRSSQRRSRLHLAVVGKGGAGKSLVAGTLARLLARAGHRVLALDSDTMPGLAYSLGAEPPPEPPLLAAAEKDERGRWRARAGIGPVRAVQRYATSAPDGVLLLQSGKTTDEGIAPVLGSVTVFYKVVQRIGRARFFRDWAIVGDLSAGPRQTAFRWAAYADTVLLVVEPTWKSILTAQRIRHIAASISGARVAVVANKLARAADADEIGRRLGEPVLAAVPADEAVRDAERSGLPLLDHAPDAPATIAIARLAERLEAPLAVPSSDARAWPAHRLK